MYRIPFQRKEISNNQSVNIVRAYLYVLTSYSLKHSNWRVMEGGISIDTDGVKLFNLQRDRKV